MRFASGVILAAAVFVAGPSVSVVGPAGFALAGEADALCREMQDRLAELRTAMSEQRKAARERRETAMPADELAKATREYHQLEMSAARVGCGTGGQSGGRLARDGKAGDGEQSEQDVLKLQARMAKAQEVIRQAGEIIQRMNETRDAVERNIAG